MKLLFITFIVLLTSCGSTKYSKSKHLDLVSATQQSFVKGMQNQDGSDSGTHYKMEFSQFEGVEITHLWIRKSPIEFASFEHEDKMYITATRYSQIDVDINKDKKALPFDYDGKALIEYKFNDKITYLIVEDFVVKERTTGK